MRKVRASVWLIVSSLVISAALALIPSLRLSAVPTETPARVRVTHVVRGDVQQTVHARGQVRREQEYAVLSPVTGIAEAVYVEPGDNVTKGQALLRIDDAAAAAAASSAYAAMSQDGVQQEEGAALSSKLTAYGSVPMEALTLRAASDGQVLDVLVGQYGGLTVGSGAVLIAGGTQQVVCAVSARDTKTIEKGMRAVLSADGDVIGTACVRRVGMPVQDGIAGQTVCEVLLVPDDPVDLPYGSTVEAEIVLKEALHAATLPVTAVTDDGTVWVISEGRCWEMKTEVLLADEMRCWVALPDGTAVADAPEGLINGQRVKEVSP